MGKYVVIDERQGDTFTEEFNKLEEALTYASLEWGRYSDIDKKKIESFYVLESVNSDEEADNHLDGDIVRSYRLDGKTYTLSGHILDLSLDYGTEREANNQLIYWLKEDEKEFGEANELDYYIIEEQNTNIIRRHHYGR